MNKILQGDALEVLTTLKSESIDCVITSPPYWGLRDYGVKGQLGLEKTPEEYVAKMVEVFREVKRVLKKEGTLWLNMGDSYAGGNFRYGTKDTLGYKQASNKGSRLGQETHIRPEIPKGLKPKDLVGIPWRVALALQADGWYLRQDIIWSKPNPMPESVTDRCTKSHEYIFLLSKNAKYYYDAAAIAEPLAYASVERLSQPNLENQVGSDLVPGKTNGNMKSVSRESWNGSSFDKGKTGEMKRTRGYTKPYDGQSTKDYAAGGAQDASATKARIVDGILSGDITTRNKRSVWTVTTKPFSGAHFATFPPDLIEPCILAGSKPGDTVLDPFFGSGTTGEVAQNYGRQRIGC